MEVIIVVKNKDGKIMLTVPNEYKPYYAKKERSLRLCKCRFSNFEIGIMC